MEILCHLDDKDLASISMTCSGAYGLVKNNRLWKAKVKKIDQETYDQNLNKDTNWFNVYRDCIVTVEELDFFIQEKRLFIFQSSGLQVYKAIFYPLLLRILRDVNSGKLNPLLDIYNMDPVKATIFYSDICKGEKSDQKNKERFMIRVVRLFEKLLDSKTLSASDVIPKLDKEFSFLRPYIIPFSSDKVTFAGISTIGVKQHQIKRVWKVEREIANVLKQICLRCVRDSTEIKAKRILQRLGPMESEMTLTRCNSILGQLQTRIVEVIMKRVSGKSMIYVDDVIKAYYDFGLDK